MGVPDRPARDRAPTATTSSPAGSTTGSLVAEEVVPDAQPVDGHPGVVQPRAPAVRAARAGTARAPPSCSARFRGVGSVEVPAGPALRGGQPRRRRHARRDPRRARAHRGCCVDPHTAVGIGAARACRRDPDVPMVCLATAHPAKFPDAVEQATGIRPPLPERLADLLERAERYDVLPADLATRPAPHRGRRRQVMSRRTGEWVRGWRSVTVDGRTGRSGCSAGRCPSDGVRRGRGARRVAALVAGVGLAPDARRRLALGRRAAWPRSTPA